MVPLQQGILQRHNLLLHRILQDYLYCFQSCAVVGIADYRGVIFAARQFPSRPADRDGNCSQQFAGLSHFLLVRTGNIGQLQWRLNLNIIPTSFLTFHTFLPMGCHRHYFSHLSDLSHFFNISYFSYFYCSVSANTFKIQP